MHNSETQTHTSLAGFGNLVGRQRERQLSDSYRIRTGDLRLLISTSLPTGIYKRPATENLDLECSFDWLFKAA